MQCILKQKHFHLVYYIIDMYSFFVPAAENVNAGSWKAVQYPE